MTSVRQCDLPWQLCEKGVRLRVHLQPRASQNRIMGLHGDALKIALTAPPVEGAANAALLRFLAKLFALPVSSVIFLGGEKSREKYVLLCTATPERAIHTLRDVLQRVDKKTLDD